VCNVRAFDGLANDNDFGEWLCIMCGLTVTKAMMPCAERALNDQQTSGRFLGTNEFVVNSASRLLDLTVGDPNPARVSTHKEPLCGHRGKYR